MYSAIRLATVGWFVCMASFSVGGLEPGCKGVSSVLGGGEEVKVGRLGLQNRSSRSTFSSCQRQWGLMNFCWGAQRGDGVDEGTSAPVGESVVGDEALDGSDAAGRQTMPGPGSGRPPSLKHTRQPE